MFVLNIQLMKHVGELMKNKMICLFG